MKGRYAVIVWSALVSLIGMSWLATRAGTSTFDLVGITMIGEVVALVVAFLAMIRGLRTKMSAFVVLLCTAPLLYQAVLIIEMWGALYPYYGLPLLLMVVGGVLTFAASLFVLIAPVPPLPAPPVVAPARVVGRATEVQP